MLPVNILRWHVDTHRSCRENGEKMIMVDSGAHLSVLLFIQLRCKPDIISSVHTPDQHLDQFGSNFWTGVF